MAVLHLIQSARGVPLAVMLTAVRTARAALPAARGPVWAVGKRDIVDAARGVGLSVERVIGPGGGLRVAMGLGRAIGAMGTKPDAIHVWSGDLIGSVLAGVPRSMPVVVSAASPVGQPIGPVGRFLLSRRTAATRLLAMTDEAGESFTAAGYPSIWIDRVASPAIPALIRGAARRPLRMRWGAAGEGERVALLVGLESAGAEGLLTAALGLGLARETGRSLRLLVSPEAAGLERLRRMLDSASRSRLVIVDEAANDPAEAGPAADLAIVLGDSIALPWAVAAGLAVIAADTPALRGVLPGGTVLWFPPGSSGKIARHAAKLADSAEVRARSGGEVRAALADRYSPRRFVAHLAGLYQSVGVAAGTVGPGGSADAESSQVTARRA